MIWLTWRQFRAQAIAAAAILAAAAICFLISGLRMHHAYAGDLAMCPSQNDCSTVLNQFQNGYNAAFQLAELLMIAVPGLIGVFWGAPLISRELETGTHQLAWNQSVTRTRWLAVKLLGVGLASIVTAALLSYLLTWWAGPLDHIVGNRFAALTFATRDIVPLGYAAFAFVFGATAGLLIRRTIPAMAVTLAVFIGIQILVPTTVRPHLVSSTSVTFPINQTTLSHANGVYGSGGDFHVSGLPIPAGAWVLSITPVRNASGQVVHLSDYSDCFAIGPHALKGNSNLQQVGACLAGDDLHESVTYQPASDYWPLQWYETGLFLALTGVLSGVCFWWIRRRQN